MTKICKLVRGTFVHSASFDEIQVLQDVVVGVDSVGVIAFIVAWAEVGDAAAKYGFVAPPGPFDGEFVDTTVRGKAFLVPGYVDTHVHAPQYAFAGRGNDMPLLDWLDTYTYPMETRFSDVEFANKVYSAFLARIIKSGTTTAAMYGSLHAPATLHLAELVVDSGMRGLVGKVCMDSNAPSTYIEPSVTSSLASTEQFVDDVLALDHPRVRPVVTPRFAPSCSVDLLKGLGDLSKTRGGLHVQTHVSESPKEIAWVSELFPHASHYVDVYERAGLLSKKTILGHAVHLLPDEMAALARSSTGISHCPSSNFGLESGILNVMDVLQYDIDIGLGSDVAGGCSPSILVAMRDALTASRILTMPQHSPGDRTPNRSALSLDNVFYLATMGGARVCDMHNQIGSFAVGKHFDAIVVDPCVDDSPFDMFSTDTSLHAALEKYITLGDDRNHIAVLVDGNVIFSRPAFWDPCCASSSSSSSPALSATFSAATTVARVASVALAAAAMWFATSRS